LEVPFEALEVPFEALEVPFEALEVPFDNSVKSVEAYTQKQVSRLDRKASARSLARAQEVAGAQIRANIDWQASARVAGAQEPSEHLGFQLAGHTMG
jgi:hypothetical protein